MIDSFCCGDPTFVAKLINKRLNKQINNVSHQTYINQSIATIKPISAVEIPMKRKTMA